MWFSALMGFDLCIKELDFLGASLNSLTNTGHTPAHAAAKRNHVECVASLIRLGATVDGVYAQDGTTPVTAAALRGHLECVQMLIVHPQRTTPLAEVVDSMREVAREFLQEW